MVRLWTIDLKRLVKAEDIHPLHSVDTIVAEFILHELFCKVHELFYKVHELFWKVHELLCKAMVLCGVLYYKAVASAVW